MCTDPKDKTTDGEEENDLKNNSLDDWQDELDNQINGDSGGVEDE